MGAKSLPVWKVRWVILVQAAWGWHLENSPPRPVLSFRVWGSWGSGKESSVTRVPQCHTGHKARSRAHLGFETRGSGFSVSLTKPSIAGSLTSTPWFFIIIMCGILWHFSRTHMSPPKSSEMTRRTLAVSMFVKDSRRPRSRWCSWAHVLMVKPHVFWARNCGFGCSQAQGFQISKLKYRMDAQLHVSIRETGSNVFV